MIEYRVTIITFTIIYISPYQRWRPHRIYHQEARNITFIDIRLREKKSGRDYDAIDSCD